MQLATLDEISQQLGVKRSWLRSQVFKKTIPFVKIGRHVRFDPMAIERWISQRVTQGES